jgi:hypothetical protein
MAAIQGRYAVTYRLVSGVYAMTVAPPGTNVFLCMQLLDAAAKVLVGVCRGVDVTPDKLSKRYTEVRRRERGTNKGVVRLQVDRQSWGSGAASAQLPVAVLV